jgi:hypothetical protein
VRTADLYLTLALLVVGAAAATAILRRDLLRPMATVGLIGAAWGPVSEYWFFQDYWRPPGVFGGAWLEDALFGAGVSALAFSVYPFVSRRLLDEGEFQRSRLALIPAFVLVYAIAMEVLQAKLGINSILVAMLVNLLTTAFIVIQRHDLFVPAVASAGLMAVVTVAGYVVGLDVIVDGRAVLRQIWLLHDQPLGVTVLGNVPLTEVLWYATWSAMLGVAYEYVSGARIVRSVSSVSHRTLSGPSASARPGPGAR